MQRDEFFSVHIGGGGLLSPPTPSEREKKMGLCAIYLYIFKYGIHLQREMCVFFPSHSLYVCNILFLKRRG